MVVVVVVVVVVLVVDKALGITSKFIQSLTSGAKLLLLHEILSVTNANRSAMFWITSDDDVSLFFYWEQKISNSL